MHRSATGDSADESAQIMERFRTGYGKDIDLTLRTAYRDLLAKLGNPQDHLPPIIHVAGTNGKGSTCAFIRAILEAAGYRVHVYTSPHLVRFHERIRLAGNLIEETELAEILRTCERLAEPGAVSYFEAATAAAFVAFARHPADFIILEVGMGGRLDSTNIIQRSAATAIARLSYDHREFLGDTLTAIANEKAGIMRAGVPCAVYPQTETEAIEALAAAARRYDAPLFIGGRDWQVQEISADSFSFISESRQIKLPNPALPGQHQLWNAGLAIATTLSLSTPIPDSAYQQAMQSVAWPGRLQHLTQGVLATQMRPDWELWLDGGHNDSAGEVLAHFLAKRPTNQPIHLVLGMLQTKHPVEFIAPLRSYLTSLTTISITDEPGSYRAEDLATSLSALIPQAISTAPTIQAALRQIQTQHSEPGLILITGSLYLAGAVLRLNQAES